MCAHSGLGGAQWFRQETRTFSAMTRSVLDLREWLRAERVELVAMEATADYWKPLFYVLEDDFEVWLVNAAHVKNVKGRKTDVNDAQWIAKLAAFGLVRSSWFTGEAGGYVWSAPKAACCT